MVAGCMVRRWAKILIIIYCLLSSMILWNSSLGQDRSNIKPYCTGQTDLAVSSDCAFSAVDDMVIDTKNNFIIVDSFGTGEVYVFNEKGEFVRIIGRKGKGPGEYLQPTSITIHPSGQLWICDYMNRRINIYAENYTYIKSVFIEGGRVHPHIFTPTNDDIIMYNGMLYPMNNELHDTIIKYNKTNKTITRFAPLQSEVLDINFSSMRNGIAVDQKGYIYEINPIFYQIRKYDFKGNFVKKLTPRSTIYTTRSKNTIIINGLFIIGEKYIIVQIKNHIDIYNLELNRITEELPFEEKIIYSDSKGFYTITWSYENPGLEKDCVRIKYYELAEM